LNIPETLDRIEERLGQELPGELSHAQMSPSIRKELLSKLKFEDDPTLSSVLILIYQNEGSLRIPVIERVIDGGVHGGQISFPGGKKETQDADLKATAIRETREEIGIDASNSRFLGRLSDFFIPVSNFMVSPYVAFSTASDFQYKPDKREVEQVLEIRIDEFLSGKNRMEGIVKTHKGIEIRAPYFPLGTHRLWGASAMILSELLSIIDEIHKSSS
jgi:8-oxo-dGTP pyrophosphatase MutT (NUDIX family)